jgi:hypothetical protein
MKYRLRNIVLRLSFGLVIVIICYKIILNFYGKIDDEKLLSHIYSLGLPILIIFVPYFIITLSETLGWKNCFEKNKSSFSLWKLFLLRLSTETLQTSLPGGAAYAELIRPYLLKKHLKIEYPESISADIITKVNIMIAQVIFLFLTIIIMIIDYNNKMSVMFIPVSLFYPFAAIFISLIFLFSYLLYRKNLLLHIINLLEKINLKMFRKLSFKIRKPSIEINNILSLFYRKHKIRLFLTTAFFLAAWIMMAFESLIILKVMGVNANLFQLIILESFISIIRMVFFFLPGAVGPQDAGIIMLFNHAGLPNPVINSLLFVILKRLKELFWIITGYVLLIFYGIKFTNLFIVKRRKAAFKSEFIAETEASR